jgi:hypothetical protein
LFAEGSRNLANPTVQPANEKEKKTSATCGRKCLEQFGKFNRATLWAKTFAGLLIGMEGWYSTRCRLTWKLKATKCCRFYFQLQVSTLPIDVIESGLLPTVQTQGLKVCDQNGKTQFMELGLLPTPTVMDTGATTNLEKLDERRDRLKGRNNGKNGTKKTGNGMGVSLGEMMQRGLLPTPTALSDPKGGCTREDSKRQQDTLAHAIHGMFGQTGKTSQLNPLFVQEMMGYPSDWLTLPFQEKKAQESLVVNKHTEDGEKKA